MLTCVFIDYLIRLFFLYVAADKYNTIQYLRSILLYPVLTTGQSQCPYSCQTYGIINRQGLPLSYPHAS